MARACDESLNSCFTALVEDRARVVTLVNGFHWFHPGTTHGSTIHDQRVNLLLCIPNVPPNAVGTDLHINPTIAKCSRSAYAGHLTPGDAIIKCRTSWLNTTSVQEKSTQCNARLERDKKTEDKGKRCMYKAGYDPINGRLAAVAQAVD